MITENTKVHKNHTRPIEFNGKIYKNAIEFCEEFNLTYWKFIAYRKEGYSLKEIIQLASKGDIIEVVEKPKMNGIDSMGVHYNSVDDFLDKIGIPKRIYYYAKNRGITAEDIETLYGKSDFRGSISFRGKFYNTIRNLCEDYNCEYKTFMINYKNSENVEDSICASSSTYECKHSKDVITRPLVMLGKRSESVLQFAKAYNLKYMPTLRMYLDGYPVSTILDRNEYIKYGLKVKYMSMNFDDFESCDYDTDNYNMAVEDFCKGLVRQ